MDTVVVGHLWVLVLELGNLPIGSDGRDVVLEGVVVLVGLDGHCAQDEGAHIAEAGESQQQGCSDSVHRRN